MKALADYVHGRGLKLGIYSSPGPRTCAGFEGSLGHEAQDAARWAEWGVDFLKYDWCSYKDVAPDDSLAERQKPYRVMRAALDGTGRDIVYSLCQYGMSDVWTWGAEVGGNLWRTTGDITDRWSSVGEIGFRQADHADFAGPGHWNDPDMLVVGTVGWGGEQRRAGLTRNEQISHVTLWALLPAPLLIGCDLAALDDFTRALLTNHDVLAVNQDALGLPARRTWADGEAEVWMRPLADGTLAVAAFNGGRTWRDVDVDWSSTTWKGAQPVRNLWMQRDEGRFLNHYNAGLPRHAALLLKIGKPVSEAGGKPAGGG
jgi:alpha-galactosidase